MYQPEIPAKPPVCSLKVVFKSLVVGGLLLCSSNVLFAQDTKAAVEAKAMASDTMEAATHSADTMMATDEMAKDEMAKDEMHGDEMVAEGGADAEPAAAGKIKEVLALFNEQFPALSVDSVGEGPYPGWYEVVTDSHVVYVDETVTLLFQGNVVDLASGVDLTENRLSSIRMGLINDLGEDKMLVYTASPTSERSITVFTDINCGYCRLLHSEIDTLLSNGVNVRYLMFPRAGLESESRVALESVWCADDPQQAMTSAKEGGAITQVSCETPVEEHYDLAGKVGLRGTPLIYLDNGTALAGYREAKAIIEMINSTEPMSN